MDGTVCFWKELVLSRLSASDLLIQNSFDALDELVEASFSFPIKSLMKSDVIEYHGG